MKVRRLVIWLVIAASLGFAGVLAAQTDPAPRAGKDWGQYYKVFDPKNLTTYRGEVVTLDELVPGGGMSNRVWLGLKTDKGTILVILGPAWLHQKMDFHLALHDLVEVKGTLLTTLEEPMVIATEVKKGDQVLRLRDDTGYPVWAPPKEAK